MKIVPTLLFLVLSLPFSSLFSNAEFVALKQPVFAEGDTVIPVILHFSAKKKFDQVVLDWSTSAEKDSRYFSVEKSSNGTTWSTCARVDAAGTTNTYSEYQALDYAPTIAQKFYRLKQMDWDGNIIYSNPVIMQNSQAVKIEVYPNPAKDHITIDMRNLPEGNAIINVSDMYGKPVKSLTTANNSSKLDFFNIKAGIYFVRVQKNGEVHSEKFVVE